MTTVHQMIGLPLKGTANGLGPVKVSAKFPAKAITSGKMMRGIVVRDDSGSIDMTLWGAAAELPIQDGMTVTFKGVITRGEYKDKPKLDGEKLTIEVATSASASSASTGAPEGTSKPLDYVKLAKQQAKYVKALGEALEAEGVTGVIINAILPRALDVAPLWWFGYKSLIEPKNEEEEQTPPDSDDDEIPY